MSAMSVAPYFDLTLTPNRSLPPHMARWLVVGVAALMTLGALRFLLIGAWPVMLFIVLDVALLAWAFRASYRSGRGYERVRMDDEAIEILQCAANGRHRRMRLEPFWTRAELQELPTGENRLWLRAGRRQVRVGSFLSPGERSEIHGVIADGLARYRDRRR